MTLTQLRYAITVANSSSMNEAARSLFISQPSLSTAIRELEDEIGVVLFRRTNRGISLTPEGDEFMGYASEENLEATKVAVVTEDPRLVLNWRGKDIVNLSRAFLDTNGAHQETTVAVDIPNRADTILTDEVEVTDVKEKWLETLKDLNVCSNWLSNLAL